MSEKKIEVITKVVESKCYTCSGTGYIPEICEEGYACDACPIEPCNNKCMTCEGTGIYKETYYFHCVNGICIGGDSLK